ncbi:MAG: hypothetical protein CMH27_09865 [Micavibrio sp.]|nr:hypothetical protein [Micavibrio sp.]|tara:strand:+ start:3708 stop:4430 length:723 start_codon:yes stop_codon:yes gene_type:complete
MKTNSEHYKIISFGQRRRKTSRKTERGNALLYVLIAIALFAALSFTLSRNSDNTEAGSLTEDRAKLYASQLTSYAAQAKSAVDQMLFQGAQIDQLDFTLPSEATFNTAPTIYKVYHPDGGGLIPAQIPENATNEISTTPPAGWYMGRFNNVEWTPGTDQDVILTAYQITKPVCESINVMITGDPAIPKITSGDMSDYLVPDAPNTDLTSTECAGCNEYSSLCVSNNAESAYSFYNIIAAQ